MKIVTLNDVDLKEVEQWSKEEGELEKYQQFIRQAVFTIYSFN